MARDTSPYIIGDHWLDKRDDGRSPDIWQITTYDKEKRRLRYVSTGRRELDGSDGAIFAIKSHCLRADAKAPTSSDPDEVKVVPQIILYWDEHAKHAIDANGIAPLLRHFIAFLVQDEVGPSATFSALTPTLYKRFVDWRSKPHSYKLMWKGKSYALDSEGVGNASIKKNLRIVTAALNHAVEEKRASFAPKVGKKITQKLPTPGRTRMFSIDELGAVFGFCRSDKPLYRFVCLMLATAVRPEAAMLMNTADQYNERFALLDLHPKDAPLTKKRNPVVPCIPQFATMIGDYRGPWIIDEVGEPIGSLVQRWATMREALGFGLDAVAKTIRHTVASTLEWKQCDEMQISRLLGHTDTGEASATSSTYKHYNPQRMASVRAGLIEIWDEVMVAADAWCAKYVIGAGANGKLKLVERATLAIPAEGTERLSREESMTAEQLEAWRKRRRDQINSARKARKARGANTACDSEDNDQKNAA